MNELDPTDPDVADEAAVAVVGGGLGGLIAAVTVARALPARSRVIVLEPHPPGGRARCDVRDGFTFNRGPRAIYVGGPADRLLTALGVDTTHGAAPVTTDASALRGGRLHRFPTGPISSARTTVLTSRQKVAASLALAAIVRAEPDDHPGRTVADWLDDRGLAGPPRQFVEALVRVSTYANAPEVLAAGPALANARAGIRPGVRYLDGGWQSLVDPLVIAAGALGIEVRPVAVTSVRSGSDGVVVTTTAGIVRAGAAIVASGGPDAASALLGGRPESWPVLGPPVTAACLELGVKAPPRRRFVLGIDEPVYASTHAPPARLAPEGGAVVHVMRYQPIGDDRSADDQRAQLDRVAALAGIQPQDVVAERFLARMVVSGALPVAPHGLAGRAPVAVAHHPGVFLAGDWVGDTGLLLDAVASSATTAARLAADHATRAAAGAPAPTAAPR